MTERILHLTLKKKWFDQIVSGEKKEEYREIKEYWLSRLLEPYEPGSELLVFKTFDYVVFTNGYGKDRPSVKVECKGIRFAHSDIWNKLAFVIELGDIIEK